MVPCGLCLPARDLAPLGHVSPGLRFNNVKKRGQEKRKGSVRVWGTTKKERYREEV